jgi:maltokinase
MSPDPVLTDLERFIATARWFGGKGRPFHVTGTRRVGQLGGTGDPFALIELVEVTYTDDAGGSELYQLPLALHRAPVERIEHAFIGRWDDLHVYDAVHDREAMALWLQAFIEPPADLEGLTFHRTSDHLLDPEAPGAVLTAEQSNSSVAFAEEALMKVFRKITPGNNPDIEIHDVLTQAGSDHVAALYGWLEASDSEAGVIHLAMLQQFLRTASDGWALARASARSLFADADLHAHEVGGDFAAEAARLGQALAETHETLAAAFGAERVGPDGAVAISEAMLARLDEAVTAAPDLAAYAPRLRPLLQRVAEVDDVAVQRIHGDLHLGQTLRTVKGWKLVDFEGEPARPLADRSRPESVWRDVAGMLRSFDYVAAVVQRELGEDGPRMDDQRTYRAAEWVERNRHAFLAAYAGGELTPQQQLLCDAFEVDKAIYECAYEARNRPDWLDIPLAAVARLVATDGAAVAE